jgi:DNA-directed RNA polymerase subunit RPC12/RpoP
VHSSIPEGIFILSRKDEGFLHKEPMPKPKQEQPLVVRCPNCRQTREPDYNETTKRYVCAICSEPVDAQVLIEKKKRGLK